MALDPRHVLCFMGSFAIHLDIDQVQRLLERDQLARCRDTSVPEHYHFTGQALEGAWSNPHGPIDLTSANDHQLDAVRSSVDELIAKATKGENP